MQDMLVRLLDLPDISDEEKNLFEKEGISFKRPITPEKSLVVDWVAKHFSKNWADETEAAFTSLPVNCFIAQRNQEILGFPVLKALQRIFLAPRESFRPKGGKALVNFY